MADTQKQILLHLPCPSCGTCNHIALVKGAYKVEDLVNMSIDNMDLKLLPKLLEYLPIPCEKCGTEITLAITFNIVGFKEEEKAKLQLVSDNNHNKNLN